MLAAGGPHWIDWPKSGCGRMIGPAGGVGGWLIMSPRPGWRNGIRGRLKPVCPKGHRGSTPLSGTGHLLFPREGPGSPPRNVVVKSAWSSDFPVARVSSILGFGAGCRDPHAPFGGCAGRGVEHLCSFGPLTKATTAGGRGRTGLYSLTVSRWRTWASSSQSTLASGVSGR
jgi:hypothetical protein